MPLATPPSNAPQTKSPLELEMERKQALLSKVRAVREGLMLNRGQVLKGDPQKAYMWVNINQDRQIFFQQMGWEPVKITDPTKPTVVTHWKPREDGTIVRGDLILYQIDKELAEAMQAYNVMSGLELSGAAGADFESAMGRMQVPTYRPKV